MGLIPDASVNLVCCDLPYGTTRNKWDVIIPFDHLWAQYRRILAPGGCIVLNGAQPFSSKLIMSNLDMFKYSLVWHKTSATGFLNARRQPLRAHEDILVFANGPTVYNPQKTTGHKRKVSTASHRRNSKDTENYGKYGKVSYDSTDRYPISVLTFKSDKQKSALHSTQKPVSLCEWIVKTYSNPGDLVLDNAAGSGTTGIACMNTGRQFVMMEKDPVAFETMTNRIKSTNQTIT
jgi:site-specific DNA-methyltransferase (adenine-specific)